MLTSTRRIGNSRGVLIPAAFLASCQIKDQVDMQLQDGQIVIKPVTHKLRDGWFVRTNTAPDVGLAQDALEAQEWGNAPVTDDAEWVW